jgi:hypothetical protein
MSNYVKTTDFAAKDALATGNAGKIIKGAEFEVEFDALAVAVNSKADENNAALTGTTTAVNLDVSGTLDVQGALQIGSVAITATAAEINYLDGVTSSIQMQLNSRYESGDTLAAASGTASAPSLTFAADTNTGFFRKGADTIGVSIGGTETAFIDDDGFNLNANGTGACMKYNGSSPKGLLRYQTSASSAVPIFEGYSGIAFGMFIYMLDDAFRFDVGGFEAMEVRHDGLNGLIRLYDLPTSASGLAAGTLWNDSGTLKVA